MKLCACCKTRPTKTPRAKYCEVCSQHQALISKAKARGQDPSTLPFNRLCEWCGKRPIMKGGTKYCEVCNQQEEMIRRVRKRGKDKSSYTIVTERVCACCQKRPVAPGNKKYCEECQKHTEQINQAKRKGLDITKINFEHRKVCECCGTRPVAKGSRMYCKVCGPHANVIRDAKARGADISQLPFTGNRLCEFCHKRPIAKGKNKYCEVCGKHSNQIGRAKRAGRDLSKVDFGEVKLCEYCGIRPVAKFKKKYCTECGKFAWKIFKNKQTGIDEIEDFTKPRICKHCGKPLGKGRHSYCDQCGPHARTIITGKNRGHTGQYWFDGKLCKCCGKNPVSQGMAVYCRECNEKYSTRELLLRSDKRAKKAGERLSNCTFCNQRERMPGRNTCRVCQNAIQRACYHGTYSYKEIKKIRMCECCGNRPVGYKKKKYCEICSKYDKLIYDVSHRGEDPSKLWFTGNKLCEWCGENKVSGNSSHEYCDECEKIVYNTLSARWGRVLDYCESDKPCACCKKRKRVRNEHYCRACLTEKQRKSRNRHKKDKKPPVQKSTLCVKCGIRERVKHNKYCKKCQSEEIDLYQYVGNNRNNLKPVADPEIYYTDKSVEVTCPICNAEYCLPRLPLGEKCKQRILKRKRSTTWQKVLERRGIRPPTLSDISPVDGMLVENCTRCKAKPKKPGYIYCEECMEIIKQERIQEFKQSSQIV